MRSFEDDRPRPESCTLSCWLAGAIGDQRSLLSQTLTVRIQLRDTRCFAEMGSVWYITRLAQCIRTATNCDEPARSTCTKSFLPGRDTGFRRARARWRGSFGRDHRSRPCGLTEIAETLVPVLSATPEWARPRDRRTRGWLGDMGGRSICFRGGDASSLRTRRADLVEHQRRWVTMSGHGIS